MSEQKWVLVPKEMVQKTVLYGDWEEPPLSVGLVIPQIPADVFAAMVERGARAAINPLAYDTMTPDLQEGQRRQFARGLRAALGISDEV